MGGDGRWLKELYPKSMLGEAGVRDEGGNDGVGGAGRPVFTRYGQVWRRGYARVGMLGDDGLRRPVFTR